MVAIDSVDVFAPGGLGRKPPVAVPGSFVGERDLVLHQSLPPPGVSRYGFNGCSICCTGECIPVARPYYNDFFPFFLDCCVGFLTPFTSSKATLLTITSSYLLPEFTVLK
jgi:hypothetical protein